MEIVPYLAVKHCKKCPLPLSLLYGPFSILRISLVCTLATLSLALLEML